jgi:TonB family protein
LGFSARHEGTDWQIMWSRDALARVEAVGAMLTIRDAGVDRLQFLSAQDLASGSLFYVPRSSDLTFNLKVNTLNGPVIEEQIRVLGAGLDIPASLTPMRRTGEAQRDYLSSIREAPRTLGEPVHAPPVTARKTFQPPATQTSKSGAPAELAAMPDVHLPASSSPQLTHVASAPPPPAPNLATKTVTPTPPLVSAPTPSLSAAAPPKTETPALAARQKGPSWSPASPIQTVKAAWPRGAARNGAMEVQVKVQIDVTGRVTTVIPSQRTVTNYAFVDSAIAAARTWTFSPARENGHPVPSESVLTFKFTP